MSAEYIMSFKCPASDCNGFVEIDMDELGTDLFVEGDCDDCGAKVNASMFILLDVNN